MIPRAQPVESESPDEANRQTTVKVIVFFRIWVVRSIYKLNNSDTSYLEVVGWILVHIKCSHQYV